MRAFELKNRNFTLRDNDVMGFFERRATAFGNGAKIDCPKEYLGKRVYVLVCEE